MREKALIEQELERLDAAILWPVNSEADQRFYEASRDALLWVLGHMMESPTQANA